VKIAEMTQQAFAGRSSEAGGYQAQAERSSQIQLDSRLQQQSVGLNIFNLVKFR